MIGLLREDYIFDAVLYAVEIVATHYTVQHEHFKTDVVGCVNVLVSNSLWYVSAKNWKKWMTSG